MKETQLIHFLFENIFLCIIFGVKGFYCSLTFTDKAISMRIKRCIFKFFAQTKMNKIPISNETTKMFSSSSSSKNIIIISYTTILFGVDDCLYMGTMRKSSLACRKYVIKNFICDVPRISDIQQQQFLDINTDAFKI